ncbi:FN3 domain-containing metallophosphoesterase family protein [Sphingobacterium paramultivorum]|uniref:FN3 domain-containing metallophosphoesterase family protein n=1 Tax=Sphingobacterium paramultivorum TaxID=2886510 RepID=UPI00192D933B|nr:FN3 domain-containing metallophosphoesterase family protein [Sphingobacterium paramultivorum]WSO12646.1 FN3 domain-containing metallophosphoesterase family protein [Sphingobacterium paramultivorum]
MALDDSSHFYFKERPKYYAAAYGFKKVGTLHQVTLTNLKPGTRYRYRVYSQEVLKHVGVNVQYGKVVATDVYQKAPLVFQTFGMAKSTHFMVVNDIHERNEVLDKLLDIGGLKTSDFVVFNGDMVSNLLSETQLYEGFMDTAIKKFASEKPMFYSRGNHETRGPFATEYPQYFPTPTGKLYYQFRHGNAGFIILDCGEDKPDTDIEYSGIVDMDNYRSEQAAWLAQAIEDPSFKDAKYKIVICHMPPFGGWHGEQEILEKFVPILNKAGTQIMLSGHLHRHIIKNATNTIQFPVIVNSNNNVLRVDLDDEKGIFKILDQQGKTVDQVIIKPLK